MQREVIVPNYHVVLVHLPIALLVAGVVIELLAFLWRRSSLRVAGKWMILLGALGAVPTATAGLYAMADLNRGAGESGELSWAQIRAVSAIQGETWAVMRQHAIVNASATLGVLAIVALWLGCSDLWRRRLHVPLLVLLMSAVAVTARGAWLGGEMVFVHGVGVNARAARGAATVPVLTLARRDVTFYLPPLEIHVIVAGIVIAAAAAALGVSSRAAATYRGPDVAIDPQTPGMDYAAAFVPRAARGQALDDIPPRANQMVSYDNVPAGRFWLVTFGLGVITALLGVWVLAHWTRVGTFGGLREIVIQRDSNQEILWTRRLMHVMGGGAIIVLPLLLALAARIAPGRGIVLGLFALLLLGAVGVQIWLGTLLLLDGPRGPLTGFNAPAATTAPAETAPTTYPTTEY